MPKSVQSVAFVSTMDGHNWGGSEELWSRTAVELCNRRFAVSASVVEWDKPHGNIRKMEDRGVNLWLRPQSYPFWKRGLQRVTRRGQSSSKIEVEKMLAAVKPSLVVLSAGAPYPPADLMELCISKSIPFVTIGQANWEDNWVPDEYAGRCRNALASALRCYFVSIANLRLTEKQLGHKFTNAEVVRNPFNVEYDSAPSEPTNPILQMACVGRLNPPSKGQDILFEALAQPIWLERDWQLNLFGEGPQKDVLVRLVKSLNLSHRVHFAGHKAPFDIWCDHHVLVLPSRAEGLPLAMVEAMLCGRPVVATNVAGHAEIMIHGKTGFLADAPTPASVSAALELFWANREHWQQLGRADAARARELVPRDPIGVFAKKIMALIS